jgi:putative transposase
MKYGSDLSDKQWAMIEAFTERSDPRGAVRQHSMREIINAILYLNKTGCQWRMLPRHFPPWQSVYDHYRRLQQRGLWEELLLQLNAKVRQKKGVTPAPATSSLIPKASKPMPKAKREASTEAKRSKGAAARLLSTPRG